MNPTPDDAKLAYFASLEAARRHHLDFPVAVRRVLGTGEWRSDEDRINAAEAKRQRRMERNLRNQRPKEVTRNG